MGSTPVVLVEEGIDQDLELAERTGLDGLGPQPFLHRLLESLDLSAGGGVAGAGVLLDHVEAPEFVLEGVASAAAAGETNRVDHAVIGQRGGRDPVRGEGFAERVHHDLPGDLEVRGDVQGVRGCSRRAS
jgi:hypothetical protein